MRWQRLGFRERETETTFLKQPQTATKRRRRRRIAVVEGKEKEIAPLIESRYHLHPLSSSLKNFLGFLWLLFLVYGLGFFKWFLV